jgi:hypothetical protein
MPGGCSSPLPAQAERTAPSSQELYASFRIPPMKHSKVSKYPETDAYFLKLRTKMLDDATVL